MPLCLGFSQAGGPPVNHQRSIEIDAIGFTDPVPRRTDIANKMAK